MQLYVVWLDLTYGDLAPTILLAAYVEEWIFDASLQDPYVPQKVHLMRRW